MCTWWHSCVRSRIEVAFEVANLWCSAIQGTLWLRAFWVSSALPGTLRVCTTALAIWVALRLAARGSTDRLALRAISMGAYPRANYCTDWWLAGPRTTLCSTTDCFTLWRCTHRFTNLVAVFGGALPTALWMAVVECIVTGRRPTGRSRCRSWSTGACA